MTPHIPRRKGVRQGRHPDGGPGNFFHYLPFLRPPVWPIAAREGKPKYGSVLKWLRGLIANQFGRSYSVRGFEPHRVRQPKGCCVRRCEYGMADIFITLAWGVRRRTDATITLAQG